MKKILFLYVFLILCVPVFAQKPTELPRATGYVNDFAKILHPSELAALNSTLTTFEKETSNEVVVVTVSSLEGIDRFDYSQQLFTHWKIGKEGRNNGILFLIAPNEREAFINVGRGLEGALTDSTAGLILRNEVFPRFKELDYNTGISAGVEAIIAATKGEYIASAEPTESFINPNNAGILFFFGLLLVQYLLSFLGRSKSWWLGGVLGGAGGAAGGQLVGAGFLFPMLILGAIGFVLDFIVSKNYQSRKASGKSTDFWGSGGGFFGGGFGGGSGGGFGGFGGGMSGGGGAGGRW